MGNARFDITHEGSMKFNKNHEIWKSAPWHVKLSVLGVPSLKALYLYAYAAFFIGLICVIAGLAAPALLSPELFRLITIG